MKWINTTYKEVLGFARTTKKQKQFCWMILAISVIILGISFYKNQSFTTPALICGGTGALFLIISFTLPLLVKPLLLAWLFLGKMLGEITSTLIFFVVYFFAFAPITFFKRVFTKNTQEAGWIKREEKAIDYKKMY